MKSFPFKEGDDYWMIDNGFVEWSCWDDVSEELYSPNNLYFKTEQEAIAALEIHQKQQL